MKKSAGILLFRRIGNKHEFFIVHPGGPFWSKKDRGAWSIPKGEFNDDEEPLDAACREFFEETGFEVTGDFIVLAPIRQKSGKWVHPFALEHDLDASAVQSNFFEMEWPPNSGKKGTFPEIDKAMWADESTVTEKLNEQQLSIIQELLGIISSAKRGKQNK